MQQEQTGAAPEPFTGIEVFSKDHFGRINPGDLVEVEGFVDEAPRGLTIIKMCPNTVPKVLKQAQKIPDPIKVKTSLFHEGACNQEVEGLEGMLVELENVQTMPCVNPITGAAYDYCSAGVRVADTESWDKYKQMWIADVESGCNPRGDLAAQAGCKILQMDNHMFATHEKFQTTPGAIFSSIKGVVSFWSDPCTGVDETQEDQVKACRAKKVDKSHWDLIPRFEADVTGPAINLANTETKTIAEVQNQAKPHGNDKVGVDTRYLGTETKNSEGASGTGHWKIGSCPTTAEQEWYDSNTLNPGKKYGSKRHALCSCFPPNTLSDLGRLAGEYIKIYGTVYYIDNPKKSFYMHDETKCGQPNNGLFVYRNDGTILQAGDKVELIAKPYAYYGSEQLSDPLRVTVIQRGLTTCSPYEVPDGAASFHRDTSASPSFCGMNGPEPMEGMMVKFKNMKVVGFTEDEVKLPVEKDADGKDAPVWLHKEMLTNPEGVSAEVVSDSGPYQNRKCSPGNVRRWQGCQMILEDQNGKQVLIDNKHKGIEALFVKGGHADTKYANMDPVKVGDTFTEIECIVDQHRGEYPKGFGGHYDCNPISSMGMKGWNEPFPAPTPSASATPSEKSGSRGNGAIAGIAVGCAVGAVALLW